MEIEEPTEIRFEAHPGNSEEREALRQLLAQRTEEFLAQGGQVEQVGFQMKDTPEVFVINPRKTPVYAHLFQQSETGSQEKPLTAQAEPERELPVERLPGEQLAARLMVQAALGASPRSAAKAVGITEKHARQIARDYRIKFSRER
ncbi:hypothetical protein NNO07_11085 [Pseudomonas resinovorans]|uniref:Uncharacterized protein n=1 Tax=Metapseudomonas resinovorans TaxID=53412 RepID=A0ABT4Y435_METRE|nr:hypothetical protein [Pseudomonas resinovorans]MDA8483616.1 hypothetical protein [Pseudomonas resinovorans]